MVIFHSYVSLPEVKLWIALKCRWTDSAPDIHRYPTAFGSFSHDLFPCSYRHQGSWEPTTSRNPGVGLGQLGPNLFMNAIISLFFLFKLLLTIFSSTLFMLNYYLHQWIMFPQKSRTWSRENLRILWASKRSAAPSSSCKSAPSFKKTKVIIVIMSRIILGKGSLPTWTPGFFLIFEQQNPIPT